MNRSTRRQFLQTSGVAGLIGSSGCLRLASRDDSTPAATATSDSKDTDGDGVIDSEDYAPQDASIQDAEQSEESDSTLTETGTSAESTQQGYFGTYYDLPSVHPDIGSRTDLQRRQDLVKENLPLELTSKGEEYIRQFDWYSSEYKVFSRVDRNLHWSEESFTPISESPRSFAAQWTATVSVAESGNYNFRIGSDDDTWVFLDDQLVLDNGYLHAFNTVETNLRLREGQHSLDIFYANRLEVAGLYFDIDDRLRVNVSQRTA